MPEYTYRRIGHKGADAIVTGNTLESFEAAAEAGVDMIEFDVLRNRDNRLVVAHDFEDLRRRRAMLLTEVLDAFRDPPLDKVEIDLDLKLPGREAELAGTITGHGLVDRAMVSTMEIESLQKLRTFEPDLRLGWTVPKTRRDWTRYRWASAGIRAGVAQLRRRLPKQLAERAPQLGVAALWAYHPLVSARLLDVADQIGIEVYAWTVDDPTRLGELIGMGVHGICSNDPRLFALAEAPPEPPPEEAKEKETPDEAAGDKEDRKAEKKKAKAEAKQAKAEAKSAKKAAKEKGAPEDGEPAEPKPQPAAARSADGGGSKPGREEVASQETQEWVLPEKREG